ncbi:hypothetical protein LguiA_017119 [Lonicera macranthoides]
MGSGKHRWKISFHWSPSNLKKQPPKEFICPISNLLMADPVIVSSGQTFERNCVLACKSLSFKPTLSNNSTPDFTTIIPNLALKSTILNWCKSSLLHPPIPLDFHSAKNIVCALKHQEFHRITEGNNCNNNAKTKTESSNFYSSSDESVTPLPLPLTTRPSCYSSSSSSEIEALTLNPSSTEEEENEFISKLRSYQVFEQEEALISLRKITRTRTETRASLCTPRMLSNLRSLITSRYATIQVNSVAVVVNLSLDSTNKVKLARSGIIPPLIDVLKGGFLEAQDHAAGALFSLALDDQNKTAIGVLGALPPLLHALRSDSERARNDSALALYHLSLVQSNRAKLVKLGAVQMLLGLLRAGHMTSRVLLILCNMAASAEGRAAMLDAGGVESFVGMLSKDEFESDSTRESCVAALNGLSQGGLRFKGLASQVGAEDVLRKVEKEGSERAREKARRILEVLKRREEEVEEVDWEALLGSGEVSRTRIYSDVG